MSVGAPLISINALELGAATPITIADRSAACINDVANALIVEGENDAKNLTLTCAKSFFNKDSGFLQGKVSDFLIDSLFSYKQKQ